ncbi:MAG: MotA/TolQ/ExbB proton channel family protein [Phycisphaerae bacterium]|jgi:chemotaxis protein MotA|nr:MotA/TolQ/ExbB proton channel family protein [Phycisphaerae bacterium]
MVDRATVVGLVLTILLLTGVMVAGTGLSAHVFWQASSLALVLGGAVLTTVMSCPAGQFRCIGGMMRNAFYVSTRPIEDTLVTLIALGEVARRQGLLALDRPVAGLRDDFLKRAVHMAVDGYEPSTIRTILQAELESIDLRHRENWGMLESIGRSAPTFGMMGTLIGLVVMLGRMDDPSRIGPGMAVALMTTLYGLIIANVFCMPLVRKLSQRNGEELLCKTMALEGVLAIQAGEHPRMLAQRLQVLLPPQRRPVRLPKTVAQAVVDEAPVQQPAAGGVPGIPVEVPQPAAKAPRPTVPQARPPIMPPGPIPGVGGDSPTRAGRDGRRGLVGVA